MERIQKKIFGVVLAFCLLTVTAFAQLRQPVPQAAEILASIDKLNVLGSVLYLAAHPDDENTRLIAWLAREKQYRTAYLSLTRGDGGQNLIGTELAEELGLIRTQELLAARQVDGGEQYFSRANDFGFSKTPEETLDFWGKEAILADAVWVIRNLKPDIIITRFPPDPRGGHGHHQAATILAIEAFSAAADPQRFPEQLRYVQPWQARRLLWNAANFGGQNNTTESQFSLDIGDYNPVIGQSYGEIAAASRSNHKSQGFGAARQRGSVREYFEVLEGSRPQETLMDGVDVSWGRVPGASHISGLVGKIATDFDVRHPERSVPALLDLLDTLHKLEDGYWKSQKIKEVQDIILACAGIWFESYASAPKMAVGETVQIRTDFIVRRPGLDVRVGGEQLPFNTIHSIRAAFRADHTTQPYWLRKPLAQARFAVDNLMEIGQAGNPDGPQTKVVLSINGREIRYQRPVVYKFTDPVDGEIHQPLVIAPKVTAGVSQKALVFAGEGKKELDVLFTNHVSAAHLVSVRPLVPEGWKISPALVELSFSGKDEEVSQRFTIEPPAGQSQRAGTGAEAGADSLHFLIRHQNDQQEETARIIRVIRYPHIPLITYFPPSGIRLSRLDEAPTSKRIAYIAGAGDLIPEALRQIGMSVDLLEEQDVVDTDLSRYDAVISGIRAYNVNKRMPNIQPRLMEYVRQGGIYLMQYNVNSGLSTTDFGPYPFKLSRLRVTDETAPVRFRLPDSPELNFPNKISAQDFEGWVQERGLYFAIDIDPAYQTPLSMNDPGETSLDGALLVGRHGKGKFVYTSLAFFRQLPAGIPGAYRLFINLLSNQGR